MGIRRSKVRISINMRKRLLQIIAQLRYASMVEIGVVDYDGASAEVGRVGIGCVHGMRVGDGLAILEE